TRRATVLALFRASTVSKASTSGYGFATIAIAPAGRLDAGRHDRRPAEVSRSGRGRRRQGALRERLLPCGQRSQRRVPSLDLAIGLDRKAGHVGEVQRRAEREVRQGEPIAGDEALSLELAVQDLGVALEQFRSLGQRGRVGLAALQHDRLDDVLEDE